MNKRLKLILTIALIFGLVGAAAAMAMYLRTHNVAVLNPQGPIASQQRQLIVTATIMMALVVIPVFGLTIGIAWRYREGNTKAKYSPGLGGNALTEAIWWLVPFAIIVVLASLAWTSSHQLDQSRPISGKTPPLRIQVIALQWKWLFIYPNQHIATVNFIQLPINTPVDFQITSDAPMNSFWIPQLGGQIYAMPGMSTQLHLMATSPGDYRGSSANISGRGFAGMTFTARAGTQDNFNRWAEDVARSPRALTPTLYNQLAQPSSDNPPSYYRYPPNSGNLYATVIMKYIAPPARK